MFILKKLFQLRDAGDQNNDIEKPFIEHLEDLRNVAFKIVITLVVATLVCYMFRGTLMDVLRRPIERVWTETQENKLPESISPDRWEQAKKAADVTQTFTAQQQKAFYAQFEDEELRYYAQVVTYYRAALFIEDLKKRQTFIDDLPQVNNDMKELLSVLLEKEPSDAVDAKGNIVYMRSLRPTETFMLAIKLSVFAGIIISFPLLLYFILQFVLPGLKENERKALWPALIVGFGLFLLGVCFCYFVVLPKALDFFYTYSGELDVENEWRIGDYITFTTQFTLIFGLAFELPVIVMTIVKLGLLNYQTMSNTRAYAVLSIFVVGAVITPTGDAFTLLLLAAPMCLLYEMCIWLAYFHNKKEAEREAQEEAEIAAYRKRKAGDSDEFASDSEDFKPSTSSKNDNGVPVPIPVPGRISTQDDSDSEPDAFDEELLEVNDFTDDQFDDDDYHEEFDEEHFSEEYFDEDGYDEGDEFDDGELEEFTQAIEGIRERLGNAISSTSDDEEPEKPLEKDSEREDGTDESKDNKNNP